MQAGLTYPDAPGVGTDLRSGARLSPAARYPDPDHSWEGGRVDVQRRRHGRLPGWPAERRVRDRLLRRDRPARSSAAGARVHDLRPVLRVDPRRRPIPNRIFMHAAQTDRLDEHAWHLDPADDLGSAGRARRQRVATTTRTFRSSCSGAEVPADHDPYAQFLADAATGNLPERVSSSTRASSTTADGISERRSSPRRHPRRRRVPRRESTRPSPRARSGEHGVRRSPTTSGAASSTTSRRRAPPRPTPSIPTS